MADELDTTGGADGGAGVTLLGGALPVEQGVDTGAQEGGAKPADAPAGDKWFADDWREKMVAKLPAAEQAKELARLKRFASPDNVYASNRNLEKRMATGATRTVLPENPSPEEVAAFRKANDIPEAPEGYELKFPEGVTASETDQAELSEFAKQMHDQNAPPAMVKKAFEAFLGIQEQAAQRRHVEAQQKTIEARAEIRSEYGRDYQRNMNVADGFLVEHAGEGARDLMSTKLADGTLLGDNAAFVKMIVNASLAYAGDEALAVSDVAGSGGASIDDRIKANLELMAKDPKAYYRDEKIQAEMTKLYAAKEARDARGQRAA